VIHRMCRVPWSLAAHAVTLFRYAFPAADRNVVERDQDVRIIAMVHRMQTPAQVFEVWTDRLINYFRTDCKKGIRT